MALNWLFPILWQVVALASTAHLSMDAGRWYPLAALLLALPFVVPDRLPFSIEPAGCPTELHHMVRPCPNPGLPLWCRKTH